MPKKSTIRRYRKTTLLATLPNGREQFFHFRPAEADNDRFYPDRNYWLAFPTEETARKQAERWVARMMRPGSWNGRK